MDTSKHLCCRVAQDLDRGYRCYSLPCKSTHSLFTHPPKTLSRVKDFVECSELYDTTEERWTDLDRSENSPTSLCIQLVALISAIISFFNIQDRKVSWRHMDQEHGCDKTVPEIMVMGRGGTSFKNQEFPAQLEYSACATPLIVYVDNDFPVHSKHCFRTHEIAVQMGVLAYKCFLAQPNRQFVHTFVLEEDIISVFQFDRGGCMYSDIVNIHKHPEVFVQWLLAAVSADETALGFDITLKWKHGKRVMQSLDKRSLPAYFDVEPLRLSMTRHPRLVGPEAQHWKTQGPDCPYIITEIWRLVDGLREEEFLATTQGMEGVAQLVSYETGAKTAGLWYEPVPGDYEGREFLRTIVSGHDGRPLICFKGKLELLSAFRDAVAGHRNLLKARILHRYINPVTVLYGINGCKPGNRGVIHGFDKARWLKKQKPEPEYLAHHANGGFSSLRVLANGSEYHDYLDDLQSFFYILAWICIGYDGPRQPKSPLPPILQSWIHSSTKDRRNSKAEQHQDFQKHFARNVSPYFGDTFIQLLRDLHEIFWHVDPKAYYVIPLPGSAHDTSDVYDRYLSAIDNALFSLRAEDNEDIKPPLQVLNASPRSTLASPKRNWSIDDSSSDDVPIKKRLRSSRNTSVAPENREDTKPVLQVVNGTPKLILASSKRKYNSDERSSDDLPIKKRLRSSRNSGVAPTTRPRKKGLRRK